MIGKRFLDSFLQVKRVVMHAAWREMAAIGLGRAQIALIRGWGEPGQPRNPRSRARRRSIRRPRRARSPGSRAGG